METTAKVRRCCGIDVHKNTVVVCVLPAIGTNSKKAPLKKRYRTFTGDLIRLRTWLKSLEVTEVALESTGVYWVPVWNVLEAGGFDRLVLANPAQVKALAGRKSDRRDCQRLAEFLQDGRLDASFVPPQEFRYLRALLRDRVHFLEQKTRVANQIMALLETANIKLGSVASKVMGVSGRRILQALIAGEQNQAELAWKAVGRLRRKRADLKEALRGWFQQGHRFRLQGLLKHYSDIEQRLAEWEAEIERYMAAYAEQVELLCTIPGVKKLVAWTLIAELGVDMSVFPTAAQCASWAGLCPGEYESAGKAKAVATKKGNRYVRRAAVQAAWAEYRDDDSYLSALFRRIAGRRGKQKAAVAVAHRIVVLVYEVLSSGEAYRELGRNYFDLRNRDRSILMLTQRLNGLGMDVVLMPRVAAAGADTRNAALAAQTPVATDGRQKTETAPPVKRKRGRPRKVQTTQIAEIPVG